MSGLKQLRYEIGVAQGDGKTPLRWIISAAALPTIQREADESGLTAHDPSRDAKDMILGLPYEIGQPSDGKDAELICAEDRPAS